MRICLAQIRSEPGHVQRNIDHHLAVLRSLEAGAADLVVFPELSLSGYDPGIAGSVATVPEDPRLHALQRFANESGTAVAVGAPLRTADRPLIVMLVFARNAEPVVIGKRHLHPDETPYFTAWQGGVGVLELPTRIGVAICYEISVPGHAEAVLSAGAELYLASVAKTPEGIVEARATLYATARRLAVPALMVNYVGTCAGKPAGGGSMVADRAGRPLAQLAGSTEALLTYDTRAGTATATALVADAGPVPVPPPNP